MLCQVFPEKYSSQLQSKVLRMQTLLPNVPAFEVFESPVEHYRARAEFRVWHEGDETFYIMFDQETKQKVRIDYCPMAIKSIADLMPKLMAQIVAQDVLRHKLFQVDFLATLSGEMLVTLIYRRPIEGDDHWLQAAEDLKKSLGLTSLIGRARKQKILLSKDYVTEVLEVADKRFHYEQVENSFTQPNPYVAKSMLSWARSQVQGIGGDLIELYCGNGNFSIALAEFYDRVLATEISKTSVASAQRNIETNQVANLQIIKLAAEEVTEALNGREFNRLKGIDLSSYDFSTIFVDPPRSGLDDLTRPMVTEYEHILYISCNPETLARDLEVITRTHEVVATAIFDQFPYTDHIESGVMLKRKNNK
jgi:tRNA (uracil-5-)-methyltransferase